MSRPRSSPRCAAISIRSNLVAPETLDDWFLNHPRCGAERDGVPRPRRVASPVPAGAVSSPRADLSSPEKVGALCPPGAGRDARNGLAGPLVTGPDVPEAGGTPVRRVAGLPARTGASTRPGSHVARAPGHAHAPVHAVTRLQALADPAARTAPPPPPVSRSFASGRAGSLSLPIAVPAEQDFSPTRPAIGAGPARALGVHPCAPRASSIPHLTLGHDCKQARTGW